MEARTIITLSVLLDLFKTVPKSIVDHFISIYSEEYSVALKILDQLHDDIVLRNHEAANVYMDLKNALCKMSPIERNRLQTECQNYLNKEKHHGKDKR